jgi:acyl dehydratase
MRSGDIFSEKFVITQDVYDSFKNVFKDFNALHTDDAYAQSKGFKEKVMHGNILNGFLSCFVGELLPFKNTIIHSSHIAYKKPCYLNDEVNLEANLVDVYESVDAYLFKFKFLVLGEIKASGEIQVGLLN